MNFPFRTPRLLMLLVAVIAPFVPQLARAQDVNAVVASLREDIRILDERTRALSIEVEQLRRENAALRESASTGNYVTVAQFNAALADLEKALRAGDKELAIQITQQLEKLAKQTNSALDALAKGGGSRVSTPTMNFTPLPADTPGVTYEVQKGDTLASIAQRYNSSVRDIQNANKIADPSTLQIGQILFVPQRK